jgi:ATP-dependent Lon protease
MKATSDRQRKKEYIMNETQRRVSATAGERKEKKKSDKHANKRSNENGMDSEIKKKTEQNKTETQKGRCRRYKFHATD